MQVYHDDVAGRIDQSGWDGADETDPAIELEHEEIVERAQRLPLEVPWLDSLAIAAGPERALVYDEAGIADIIPWRGALS